MATYQNVTAFQKDAVTSGGTESPLSLSSNTVTFGSQVEGGEMQVTINAGAGDFAGGRITFSGDTDGFLVSTGAGDPVSDPGDGPLYFGLAPTGSTPFKFKTRYVDGAPDSMSATVLDLDGDTIGVVTVTATTSDSPTVYLVSVPGIGYNFDPATAIPVPAAFTPDP